MVVFLVCWLPYHLVVLLDIFSIPHYIPFTCQLEAFLFTARRYAVPGSLVHCCVNRALQLHQPQLPVRADKAFIFKYSAKTGLTKLIDAPRVGDGVLRFEQNAK